jgi:hypothetical protein
MALPDSFLRPKNKDPIALSKAEIGSRVSRLIGYSAGRTSGRKLHCRALVRLRVTRRPIVIVVIG